MKFVSIEAPYEGGSPIKGCAEGAELLKAPFSEEFEEEVVVSPPGEPDSETLGGAHSFASHLKRATAEVFEGGMVPLVFGGDHTIAMGTWAGVLERYPGLHLIWVDAHMDAHTPETSHTGNIHGMPLAHLLQNSGLDPKRVTLLGVRSWEDEELELLERLGVKIYTVEDLRSADLSKIVDVATGEGPLGISFDLDALDPEIAPGVGTAEGGGLTLDEVLEIVSRPLVAFEVVEFNPSLDRGGKTLDAAKKVIQKVISCNR